MVILWLKLHTFKYLENKNLFCVNDLYQICETWWYVPLQKNKDKYATETISGIKKTCQLELHLPIYINKSISLSFLLRTVANKLSVKLYLHIF